MSPYGLDESYFDWLSNDNSQYFFLPEFSDEDSDNVKQDSLSKSSLEPVVSLGNSLDVTPSTDFSSSVPAEIAAAVKKKVLVSLPVSILKQECQDLQNNLETARKLKDRHRITQALRRREIAIQIQSIKNEIIKLQADNSQLKIALEDKNSAIVNFDDSDAAFSGNDDRENKIMQLKKQVDRSSGQKLSRVREALISGNIGNALERQLDSLRKQRDKVEKALRRVKEVNNNASQQQLDNLKKEHNRVREAIRRVNIEVNNNALERQLDSLRKENTTLKEQLQRKCQR